MIDLYRASEYARLHRGKTMVFKIGGACLARASQVKAIARQLSVVAAFGVRVVVVHGGGPQTSALQTLLGEEPQLVDGRRVTSATGLKALCMATLGDTGPQLACAMTAESARALSLSAAAAGIVEARRRPPMETSCGRVDFGMVGDIETVHIEPLVALLDTGLVPVIGPPAYDGEGGLLNVNADLCAAALAEALDAEKLILVSDTPGILRDPDDPQSLLSTLSLDELVSLKDCGALRDGMAVKAVAIQNALEGGVPRVHLVSGRTPDGVLGELYTTQGTGTLVTLEAQLAPLLA
ncbi:MAG: acetylglutamate kinase [bacterium]|nr:acetylglutamate kinase [Planctomycetota bacterium]HIL52508.1 acetylglutamate kinase [Planctomycetota bacterium]